MVAFPASFCIVDDDNDFVEFLADYLRARGAEAWGCESAEAFIGIGEVAKFDFFIIDLNLGRIDGVDLISLIRAQTNNGILVVSGRMGPDAFNSALAAGADMFINKPVRFDQIYHAVSSVYRRISSVPSKVDASWLLDLASGRLISPNGSEVTLSPVDVRIITALHAAGTAPVQRSELLDAQPDVSGASRNLDAAIFRLRRKIETETGLRPPFRTVHGIGFQLVKPMNVRNHVNPDL